MLNRNALKAAIVSNGYTQAKLSNYLGITPKTFSLKLKKGVFGSDEIDKMIDVLKIEDPMKVFFNRQVSY